MFNLGKSIEIESGPVTRGGEGQIWREMSWDCYGSGILLGQLKTTENYTLYISELYLNEAVIFKDEK